MAVKPLAIDNRTGEITESPDAVVTQTQRDIDRANELTILTATTNLEEQACLRLLVLQQGDGFLLC